jgi:predicted MPP superfamily phosphohydrolase
VAGAGGLSIATGLYTWRIEPHWLQIVERPLPVVNLPPSLEGATLAQLSDLHIGPRVDDDYLLSVFARVQALVPDIVVYTGDFTSYEEYIIDHTRRMFSEMPLGNRATFAVLGNHDYGLGWSRPDIADEITALAHARNVQMLRNEIGEVDDLQVVGLDDMWAGRFDIDKAMTSFDTARAAIALTHNPDTVDLPGWDKFTGWILAGHTHGGQCKAPFLPPPLLPVKNRRYTSGEFELSGNRKLYINRGVGHLLRVRINARPEVTLFRLAPA